MNENDLQRAVAKVLDLHGMTWFHPPMEGFRNPRTGAHMKAKGMKAGVPDCLIFDPECMLSVSKRNGFGDRLCGLALELKVGRNKPTPAQLDWQYKLGKAGWRVEVCRSLDEVIAVLRDFYPSKFRSI